MLDPLTVSRSPGITVAPCNLPILPLPDSPKARLLLVAATFVASAWRLA